MKLKTLVAGIVLATTAPLAMADPSLYGALDLGQSTMDIDCSLGSLTSLGFTSSTCTDKAISSRASVGYDFNDHFAIEGGYISLGKFGGVATGKNSLNQPIVLTANQDVSEIQLAAIFSEAIANNFSWLVKVGLARWDLTGSGNVSVAGVVTQLNMPSATGIDFLFGVGVKYYLNEKIAVRVQYERHNVGDSNTTKSTITMPSAGLIFKF